MKNLIFIVLLILLGCTKHEVTQAQETKTYIAEGGWTTGWGAMYALTDIFIHKGKYQGFSLKDNYQRDTLNHTGYFSFPYVYDQTDQATSDLNDWLEDMKYDGTGYIETILSHEKGKLTCNWFVYIYNTDCIFFFIEIGTSDYCNMWKLFETTEQ